MITLEQIRKNLQQEIKNSGLTQAEIARRLNISEQAVSLYICGKAMPALDTFANLCKEVGIDPLYVLCLSK